MPAANLTNLPVEMISEITSHLRPRAIANMRLVCRELHDITCPAPPLSHGSWCRFHKEFEKGARRTKLPIDLACTGCMKLLEPFLFQDSQAKRRCDRLGGRLCLTCATVQGEYNVRSFLYQKEVCFSCFACSMPKKLDEEARYLSHVSGLPLRGLVYSADNGNKRWCKDCWKVVTMYVNAKRV